MTSAQLVARVTRFGPFRRVNLRFQSSEIYEAGDDAQTELCGLLRLLEGVYDLNLTAGTERYQLSAVGATKVKLIRKTAAPYGTLVWTPLHDIERYRGDYGGSSATAKVNRYYELFTDPITIGVMGIPEETIATEVIYYRKPLSTEALSSTVNPIVPSQYDRLFFLCTAKIFIEQFPEAQESLVGYVTNLYQQELAKVTAIHINRTTPKPESKTERLRR